MLYNCDRKGICKERRTTKETEENKNEATMNIKRDSEYSRWTVSLTLPELIGGTQNSTVFRVESYCGSKDIASGGGRRPLAGNPVPPTTWRGVSNLPSTHYDPSTEEFWSTLTADLTVGVQTGCISGGATLKRVAPPSDPPSVRDRVSTSHQESGEPTTGS